MFTICNPDFVKKLEIIYCPPCAMYTLFTVIQESKFMRVHMVLWLLFCINMCLESISILYQNCSENIPLSNRTGNNTMPTRELTQNNT